MNESFPNDHAPGDLCFRYEYSKTLMICTSSAARAQIDLDLGAACLGSSTHATMHIKRYPGVTETIRPPMPSRYWNRYHLNRSTLVLETLRHVMLVRTWRPWCDAIEDEVTLLLGYRCCRGEMSLAKGVLRVLMNNDKVWGRMPSVNKWRRWWARHDATVRRMEAREMARVNQEIFDRETAILRSMVTCLHANRAGRKHGQNVIVFDPDTLDPAWDNITFEPVFFGHAYQEKDLAVRPALFVSQTSGYHHLLQDYFETTEEERKEQQAAVQAIVDADLEKRVIRNNDGSAPTHSFRKRRAARESEIETRKVLNQNKRPRVQSSVASSVASSSKKARK